MPCADELSPERSRGTGPRATDVENAKRSRGTGPRAMDDESYSELRRVFII